MADASRNPRLVVEGDSLSASGIWVPYALQEAAPSNRFALPSGYNQAVGGETALQMADQVGAVNAIRPDVVVLLAGTNDLGHGATASAVYDRLKTLWKSYLAAGADYVVAVDIPPRNDPGWMKNDAVRESRRVELNTMINNLADDSDLAGYEGRILVATAVDFDPTTDTIDGIHENAAGAQKIGTAIGAALARMTFPLPAAHDDRLRRNSAGDITAWVTGRDGPVVAAPGIGRVGPEWVVQGTGDLNGDGVSDILWRDDAGRLNAWFLDANGQVAAAAIIGTVGADPIVEGVADLNGDGVDDTPWQPSTGTINAWILGTDGRVPPPPTSGPAPSEARLVAAGDVNGDGRTDLRWRDANGDVSEWLLDGNGHAATVPTIDTMVPDWTPVG